MNQNNANALDQLFGKLSLDLFDEDKRSSVYADLEIMESNYPEAGIVLGQLYQDTNIAIAKQHYKIAADAGIAQAQWEYAKMLPHSVILGSSVETDHIWMKYCLSAAEGGCAEAANELGVVCRGKGFYAELVYWLGLAYQLEYPNGLENLKNVLLEWQKQGVSEEYKAFTDHFTELRNETALMIYRVSTQSTKEDPVKSLSGLFLKGDDLAGFFANEILEEEHSDSIALNGYQILALRGNPHGMRCYADMLAVGKGCTADMEKALQYYRKAAEAGNAPAMYVIGQNDEKNGDIYLAASWYGKATNRGYHLAGDRLLHLHDELASLPKNQINVIEKKSQMKKQKYWLADDGSVRCLENSCLEECSTGCPIYLQTMAFEKNKKGAYSDAAELFRKAVEIEPTFADGWNNLGATYGQLGDHQKAYDCYQKAYSLLKKPNPLYGMAVASKNMRHYQVAMDYVNEYVDVFGSDERIRLMKAEISEGLLSEKINARPASDNVPQPEVKGPYGYKAADTGNPVTEESFWFMNLFEFSLYSMEHKDRRITWLGQSKYQDLYQKGYALIDAKKYEEAIIVFNEALKLNPVAVSARFELCSAYCMLHRIPEARQMLESTIPYVYSKELIAKYYRSLGYILIEEKKYRLAAYVMEYSAFFDPVQRPVVNNELLYIGSKVGFDIMSEVSDHKRVMEKIEPSGIHLFDKILEQIGNEIVWTKIQ